MLEQLDNQDGEKKKALAYYHSAAEKGMWPAHCFLGGVYLIGGGTEVDVEKAVNHFEIYALHDKD